MKEIKEIGERGYNNDFIDDGEEPAKTLNEEEIKGVINSLKYTHIKQELLEYWVEGSHHYFRGNSILKNKYFIISIDNNILIFDISSGKQLKRYEILVYGEDNLYVCKANINEWNNNKDNEFILNLGGNIIMFELMKEYELKITSQMYFKDINYLKQLNEKSNRSYDDDIDDVHDIHNDDDELNDFLSGIMEHKVKDDKNCIFCVSIF